MVTVQTGLRIYCADRTKTYRKEASGPSRSDWNGRMPLLFCRRLNSNPVWGYAFRDACFGLNPGNDKFQEALNSAIYVDKTALIAYTNSVIHGCHSEALFSGLKISSHRSFHDCLNQYDTFFWNMQEFLSHSGNVAELIQRLKRLSIRELKKNTLTWIILTMRT